MAAEVRSGKFFYSVIYIGGKMISAELNDDTSSSRKALRASF